MSKTILYVDDSTTLQMSMKSMLSVQDYQVEIAGDGIEALDKLKGGLKPDLIITDINMPRMDGYEVIRNLRKNPAHKSTPILVLTTESEAEKKNLAREAGATGWMVKPFDPERLVATVRKVAP